MEENPYHPPSILADQGDFRPTDRWALAFALLFPTVSTLLYFVVLAKWLPALAVYAYVPLKAIQFGFPLYWIYIARRGREKPQRQDPAHGLSVVVGLMFGLAVLAAAMLLYHAWLKPSGFFAGEAERKIQEKVAGFHLDSPAMFIACGAFYALAHSLLEEYYWRWFVFRECRQQFALPAAIAVSSLGFMAHHVLVLGEYFGFNSPATYLLACGVAIGGAFWAWLYARYGSLLGPWLSHMLIDAAIFAIGFDLVFG